jgi:hypothetical protein
VTSLMLAAPETKISRTALFISINSSDSRNPSRLLHTIRYIHIPLGTYLHTAFGPQGDGLHGSVRGGGVLGGMGLHCVNGSPVWPSLQRHTGIWLST